MSTTAAPAAPPAAATAASSTGFTHRQILAILSGLMLGMFLAALDQNIVATSIRTIADDLQGLNLQAWATTAYLLTATISTPLYGKLSDLYGRKPFFLSAIGIFVVGSVLCTIATSMYELAAYRAIQGLGAGGLMSLALTIIGDIVPPRERARYQGFFLAVFGTSSVLGPVIGGFLAGQTTILGITGWRWVFLVNVPIGIVAFFVVFRVLNLPHTRRDHRIDWPGAHRPRGHARADPHRRGAGPGVGLELDVGDRLLRRRGGRAGLVPPRRARLRRRRRAAAAAVPATRCSA